MKIRNTTINDLKILSDKYNVDFKKSCDIFSFTQYSFGNLF